MSTLLLSCTRRPRCRRRPVGFELGESEGSHEGAGEGTGEGIGDGTAVG